MRGASWVRPLGERAMTPEGTWGQTCVPSCEHAAVLAFGSFKFGLQQGTRTHLSRAMRQMHHRDFNKKPPSAAMETGMEGDAQSARRF